MKTRLSLLIFTLLASARLRAVEPLDPLNYSPPVTSIELHPAACGLQLYVSTAGNDSWNGRSATHAGDGADGPFATLDRARDEIRKIKRASGALPAGGIAVNIAGGAYLLDHSFALDIPDSGAEGSPIIYRGAPGEAAWLIGGVELHPGDFKPVTGAAVLKRMDEAARGHVLQLDLAAFKIAHAGPLPAAFNKDWPMIELFFNDRRMPLSRWPAEGYTTIKQVVKNGDGQTPGSFIYRDVRPARWDAARGVWLQGEWRVPWDEWTVKVASIDPVSRTITLASGLNGGLGCKYLRPTGSGQEPWCAINLLEELTRPGQWCVDFPSRTLYFWPPAPLDGAEVFISQLTYPLIADHSTSYVNYIGLTIEDSLGDGIAIQHGDWHLVAGCTLRNLGGHGVVINGSHNGIQSCDMSALGQGCVIINGGDRQTLAPSGNYVINNNLHDFGVLNAWDRAGIDLAHGDQNAAAVGTLVAHNVIHDGPREAVRMAGQDNVFEYNDISHCASDCPDVGAFYSRGDWTLRGAVIRYNYIHDTNGGINPDDGSTGIFVDGNALAGSSARVWIASGPDNVVLNNLFVRPKGPVYIMDDRGVSRKFAAEQKRIKAVEAIRPDQPPWSIRYPEMPGFLASHPELPVRNKFCRNLVCIQEGEPCRLILRKETAATPGILENSGNVVTADDPGFEDATAGRYTLRKDAAVFEKIPEFPHVDFGNAGLYLDEYRKQLPASD